MRPSLQKAPLQPRAGAAQRPRAVQNALPRSQHALHVANEVRLHVTAGLHWFAELIGSSRASTALV